MKKSFLAVTILLLAGRAFSAVLSVPVPYPTIQAAIDAAANGDIVIIAPGTYTGPGNRDISFIGKAITVRSINPNDPWSVENTVIDCNWVSSSGGVLFQNNEDANSVLEGVTITNSVISAIFCFSSGPTIRNCNIIDNVVGMMFYRSKDSTIINCKIRENMKGGIQFLLGGRATIAGCDINGNLAADYPPGPTPFGGIHCDGSTLSITDCNINKNLRGAINVISGGIDLDKCTIMNNKADKGAGVYLQGRYVPGLNNLVRVSRSIISGNIADNGGGAVYAAGRGTLQISDSIISSNSTAGNGGGILVEYQGGGGFTAEGCTIAYNTAGQRGGGVYGPARFNDCILWGNTDITGNTLDSQFSPHRRMFDVSFSCIQGLDINDMSIPFNRIEDNGNIADNPLFVREPDDGGDGWGVGDNGDYGDLHLEPDSPCIDAGSTGWRIQRTDIDGQPRVMGFALDIGADEYDKLIIVKRPVKGEVWATGSKHKIEWTKFGVSGVDVRFSQDDGNNWTTIAEGIADSNNFVWRVPRRLDSNQCVISVEPGNGDTNVICYESGTFEIKPYPRRPDVPLGWEKKHKPPAPDLSDNKGPLTGCLKWVFQTAGGVLSRVAIRRTSWLGFIIYIGCEDGRVYAIDNFGRLLWSYDIGSPIVSSPAMGYYGMVYVAGQNGWLYAFDGLGRLRWTHLTEDSIYASPAAGYDGKIYVGSGDGRLYALSANGTEQWTFSTHGPADLRAPIMAAPTIDKQGTIYVGGLYDPNLYALNTRDGSVKWVCNFEFPVDPDDPRKGTNAGYPFAPCVIAKDGTIYQTLIYDTHLYAIDSGNGTIKWRLNLADADSGLYDDDYEERFWYASGWCEPAIGPDGTIYVSLDDPYLRAITPEGNIKWVTRLGMVGGFYLTVGADGLVYAASDDGFLCVVDSDGRELSRFTGSGWLAYPLIAEDGTLLVSDSNNAVWAISSKRCWRKPPVLHSPEDIQPNWRVNFGDTALMAQGWRRCTDPLNKPLCTSGIEQFGDYPSGDIDRDQYTDLDDLAVMAEQWLTETNRHHAVRH